MYVVCVSVYFMCMSVCVSVHVCVCLCLCMCLSCQSVLCGSMRACVCVPRYRSSGMILPNASNGQVRAMR